MGKGKKNTKLLPNKNTSNELYCKNIEKTSEKQCNFYKKFLIFFFVYKLLRNCLVFINYRNNISCFFEQKLHQFMLRLFSGILLFCLSFISFAQHAGGAALNYQGNSKKYENYQQFVNQGDTAMVVEVAILRNEVADAYVVTFGISQEAKTVSEATTQINTRIAGFIQELKKLGIEDQDFYMDLIMQNRVYDYELQTNNVAKEKLTGFEVKKNISIHYKQRDLIEKITISASKYEIYDLIKVDYIKTDNEKIRQDLLDDVLKILEAKKSQYQKITNIKLQTVSHIISETFDIQQPMESYATYKAYEAASTDDGYDYDNGNSRLRKLNARKMSTFYFSPANNALYDKVINPIIIEPVIQYSLRLKVRYLIQK